MATAVGVPTNGLPPGVTVTLNKTGAPPPPPAAPQSPLAQSMTANAQALSGQRGQMPSLFGPSPDSPEAQAEIGKSGWQQAMDVFSQLIQTAPWVVGMRGIAPGARPVPEPAAPNPGVLQQGQAAVESALRPQGPWGSRQEPSAPAPSPVPQTGGPTSHALNAADDAAQQGAFDASLEKAVGTAANRSVAGYNMNAAKNDPAALRPVRAAIAVEDAMSNLQMPPPKPPGAAEEGGRITEVKVPNAARPASQVSPEELRAFLEANGIPEDVIQQSLAAHGQGNPEPAPAPEPPRTPPTLPPAKATPAPRAARGGAPKPKAAAPTPPAARAVVGETPKPIEQRTIEIPDDPNAKQWLRKAAGLLRSAHSLVSLSHGNAGPLAKQTLSYMMRNYPEIKGADPQTLNKVAADLLNRLSGGK